MVYRYPPVTWFSPHEFFSYRSYITTRVLFFFFLISTGYLFFSGVTSPYEYTIALIENAVANGVALRLEHEV